MKSFRYELVVCKKSFSKEFGNISVKIKRFLGNDIDELTERFEKWFVKQPYDRNDIEIYTGEIQHANY